MLTYPTLPGRLRLLREALGLSRAELAASLTKRAPANNVGRIERGVHNPSNRTLVRLAQGLGVTTSFLANGYRSDTGASPMGWKVDEGFPARLRRAFRDQAVLPEDLAARLALTNASWVTSTLKGAIMPRPEMVVNAAKALGVSAQFLATGQHCEVSVDRLTSGQRLMLVRHAAQLSRADLAKEAGIENTPGRLGWQQLHMWETGRLRPSFKNFEQVARTLGVALSWLEGDDKPKTDSLWEREQRLASNERKILEDFRFLFESGALSPDMASKFLQHIRRELLKGGNSGTNESDGELAMPPTPEAAPLHMSFAH